MQQEIAIWIERLLRQGFMTFELISVPPVNVGMNDAGLEAVVRLVMWEPAHPNWGIGPSPPWKTKSSEASAEARVRA